MSEMLKINPNHYAASSFFFALFIFAQAREINYYATFRSHSSTLSKKKTTRKNNNTICSICRNNRDERAFGTRRCKGDTGCSQDAAAAAVESLRASTKTCTQIIYNKYAKLVHMCVSVYVCVYIFEKRVEFKHQVNVRKVRAHWEEQGRDKQGKGKGKVATAAATCRKSKTPNETLQREEAAAAAAETNGCWKRTHTMPDTMWPRGGHAFVSELPRRIVASPCGEAQTRLVLCEFSTAYCCCCCCCSTGALLRSSRNNP